MHPRLWQRHCQHFLLLSPCVLCTYERSTAGRFIMVDAIVGTAKGRGGKGEMARMAGLYRLAPGQGDSVSTRRAGMKPGRRTISARSLELWIHNEAGVEKPWEREQKTRHVERPPPTFLRDSSSASLRACIFFPLGSAASVPFLRRIVEFNAVYTISFVQARPVALLFYHGGLVANLDCCIDCRLDPTGPCARLGCQAPALERSGWPSRVRL